MLWMSLNIPSVICGFPAAQDETKTDIRKFRRILGMIMSNIIGHRDTYRKPQQLETPNVIIHTIKKTK